MNTILKALIDNINDFISIFATSKSRPSISTTSRIIYITICLVCFQIPPAFVLILKTLGINEPSIDLKIHSAINLAISFLYFCIIISLHLNNASKSAYRISLFPIPYLVISSLILNITQLIFVHSRNNNAFMMASFLLSALVAFIPSLLIIKSRGFFVAIAIFIASFLIIVFPQVVYFIVYDKYLLDILL